MSQQEQKQIHSELTVEHQKLKQMVQQDFLNVIGIAQDVQETINFFQNDPTNEMIDIQMNRLILQYNLSNGIHVDTHQQAEYQNNQEFLTSSKMQLSEMLGKVMEAHQFDERIVKYLNKYKKQNICEKPILQQESNINVKKPANFNEKVVQQVIGGMQQTDKEFSDINQGKKVQTLTQEQIETYLASRQKSAKSKLQKNFPAGNQKQETQKKSEDHAECPCIIF